METPSARATHRLGDRGGEPNAPPPRHDRRSVHSRPAPLRRAWRHMQVLRQHELFACSSNLPLSLLTGLADGLALKDRATRRTARDSPQLLGPPISDLCPGGDSAEERAAG